MNQKRGYSAVALIQPKHPANVGSALRACGCFEAALMLTTGQRFRHHSTDTMRADRRLPFIRVGETADLWSFVPHGCVPVAVEISKGAKPLPGYTHPHRALYIFGPEDGSVPPDVLSRCRDVIVIPSVECLNLAAAVNVVLYDRAAKQGRRDE